MNLRVLRGRTFVGFVAPVSGAAPVQPEARCRSTPRGA